VTTVQRITLGYNNVYAVDGDGARLLVDTGPDYHGAREHLSAALGDRLPDIVVATHGHLDHAGLGAFWQQKGVPVGLAPADFHLAAGPQLAKEWEFEAFSGYVRSIGAPADVVDEVLAGLVARRDWARRAAHREEYPAMGRDHRWPTGLRYAPFLPDHALRDGAHAGARMPLLHSPGHTPGSLVLVEETERWLFSGDQLLPEITPTPAIQARASTAGVNSGGSPDDWRLRSLPKFYGSLQRLSKMSFSRCFPGHGEPFDDVATVIAANLAQVEQRSDRVAEQLRVSGNPTLYDLCAALYPRALRRRFWQIVATVQGHCDLLEEEGRVVLREGRYELKP